MVLSQDSWHRTWRWDTSSLSASVPMICLLHIQHIDAPLFYCQPREVPLDHLSSVQPTDVVIVSSFSSTRSFTTNFTYYASILRQYLLISTAHSTSKHVKLRQLKCKAASDQCSDWPTSTERLRKNDQTCHILWCRSRTDDRKTSTHQNYDSPES